MITRVFISVTMMFRTAPLDMLSRRVIRLLVFVTRVSRHMNETMSADAVVVAWIGPRPTWKSRMLVTAHPFAPCNGLVMRNKVRT